VWSTSAITCNFF